MVGIAALPERSLILALAASQICSLTSSSLIQDKGEDMIEVRYLIRPLGSIEEDFPVGSTSPSENEDTGRANQIKTSNSEDAGGFVYSCGRSWTTSLAGK